jgi:sugar lactone lactonase YvrE
MKNKGIIIFLIILAIVIVAVMVGDWFSKRPDNMEGNKFEFSVDEFKIVPEELIHYKETKNFKLGFEKPAGLTIEGEKIYIAGDVKIIIIDISGKLLNEFELPDQPKTIEVAGEKIFVAFEKQVNIYSSAFILESELKINEANSYLTALAVSDNEIYVADAGTRKIYRFSFSGEKLNEFEGKANEDVLHGFIIPSPNFDIDINEYGDLWVVNPGLHTLENYTPEGRLREHWKASGPQTENFSGCCNPAHFCFLPEGYFVTSEKGLVRIKIYKPSGEFLSVVAPPNKFENKIEGQAPDIAVDSKGNIYALDFDRNVLRVFEKK